MSKHKAPKWPAHTPFGGQTKADLARLNPPYSWWVGAPRERWADEIAAQAERLHLIGADTPKTQKGLGDG